ncbi:MAG: hypothetical protein ACK5LP_06245 [Campylobacteraceae bacterium]
MNKNIIVFMVTLFVFFGCSSKNKEVLIKQSEFEQSVISTQKARLVLADKSTLLVMATYLNNLGKYKENKTDTIALSLYYSPSGEDNRTLDFPKVFIDNEEATVIELEKNDEVINYLPTTNSWSEYYLVMGKKNVDFKKLSVSVEVSPFSRAELTLQKDF